MANHDFEKNIFINKNLEEFKWELLGKSNIALSVRDQNIVIEYFEKIYNKGLVDGFDGKLSQVQKHEYFKGAEE